MTTSGDGGYGHPYTPSQSTQPQYGQWAADPTQAGAVQPYTNAADGYGAAEQQTWRPYSERVPERPTPQYYAPQSAPVNALAIVSLVTGVLGMGIIAVIFGHISMSQLRTSGESGRGLAIAGLVLGYAVIALFVVLWFFAMGLTLLRG